MDLFRDKVLGASFAASLVINVLLIMLLGNSHIFDTPAASKLVTIKTIRPPLIVKKPPHPPKPPPPPPQKPVVVKTPVLHPPVLQPVSHVVTYVPHVMTVQSTAPSNVAVQQTAPVAPVAQPTEPSEVSTPVAPAAPPAPAPPAAAPGPPEPVSVAAPPAPPAPARVAIPDRAEPLCLTSWPTDISSAVSYDPSSLLATTVTLTFTVDADGTVRNITFDQRTGNEDLDDYLTKIVENSRWKPAVQDGMPRAIKASHTFELQ